MNNIGEIYQLFRHFWMAGAVSIDTDPQGGFKLKHNERDPKARLSPIKFNIATRETRKGGVLLPQQIDRCGRLLAAHAQKYLLKPRAVAGVPNAGIPIARAFIMALDAAKSIKLVELGKTDFPDGTRRVDLLINNNGYTEGNVLLIDDLTNRALSKLEPADFLRSLGYEVTDVLVLMDYGVGAAEVLRRHGITLHCLITLKEVVEFYRGQNFITSYMHEAINRYLEDSAKEQRRGLQVYG